MRDTLHEAREEFIRRAEALAAARGWRPSYLSMKLFNDSGTYERLTTGAGSVRLDTLEQAMAALERLEGEAA